MSSRNKKKAKIANTLTKISQSLLSQHLQQKAHQAGSRGKISGILAGLIQEKK